MGAFIIVNRQSQLTEVIQALREEVEDYRIRPCLQGRGLIRGLLLVCLLRGSVGNTKNIPLFAC